MYGADTVPMLVKSRHAIHISPEQTQSKKVGSLHNSHKSGAETYTKTLWRHMSEKSIADMYSHILYTVGQVVWARHNTVPVPVPNVWNWPKYRKWKAEMSHM